MEEYKFLKSVSDDIRKALNSGGYRNIEFFDENLNTMDGITGENIEGEPIVAKSFKPAEERGIVIALAYNGEGKYKIMATLDKNVDFAEFDKNVGTHLKRLGGIWGSRVEYSIQQLGREIKSKDDLRKQIRGKDGEPEMSSQLSEKTSMTGTTKSSYQKIGECKVIIRHSGKVNEDKFGARSRNIDSIFIETKGGERFRMAENNLHGARAMARHLSNGGSPFDVVGNKVSTMMSEMTQLRKMAVEARKIGRGGVLSEEQTQIVNQVKSRFVELRETLKKMSGKVGYMKHSPMLEGDKRTDELNADSVEKGAGDDMVINEKDTTKVDTETKKSKKKEEVETVRFDQVPVYDRETDGRFPDLTRDADDLFSVNEDKYGIVPEDVILESWFDEAATVEFFNEEELVIEDAAPMIENTLPENALGMLNMYVGHPLFNHYMKIYETQEILDDVLALVEEDSTLSNSILTTRKNLKENPNYGTDTMSMGRNEHPSDEGDIVTDFDEALNKVNTLISDRRLNLEHAIDQVAKELVGEDQDPASYEQVIDRLWGLAEESGLVKHDFGSTFSDQVLAPNETISAHNDEIDAEEFYGDARFAESVDDIVINEMIYDDPEQAELERGMNERNIGGKWEVQPTMKDGRQMYNVVRVSDKAAGLEPMVREMDEKCDCGCFPEQCQCGPECDCGCNSIKEGDPFARQSKRNLANPKERMSLINPEDKIKSATLGEETSISDETKGPQYEEVEMPHHLPETKAPEGTPELSEDGARIIELARFRK